MAKKKISFEIICETIVHQSFEIPENYPIKNKSIQDLYEDVRSRFGDEDSSDVLTGDVDPFEFGVNNLGFNGFIRYTIQVDGEIIEIIHERKL